jgi:hypothetical protein
LFSIRVFIKNVNGDVVQVPVCFVLMSRRTSSDYSQVLEQLKMLIGTYKVQEIVSDFERAIWCEFKLSFSSIKILCCAFHWTQVMFRRLCLIGLSPMYHLNPDFQTLVRQLLCLHLIPHSKIKSTFKLISNKLKALRLPLVESYLQYVKTNWIKSTMYPPSSWSVFMQPIRTNNHAEGWHCRVNTKGSAGINFYDLIGLLYQEADLVPFDG